MSCLTHLPALLFCAATVTASFASAIEPCRIEIVDAENGWPVPLVELRTVHNVRLVSDNAGVIAFDLPELLNTETWFSVHGQGYGVKSDGFGFSGVRLTPKSGESLTVKVQRDLPAKRLGRLTGAGIFAEAHKLNDHLDWKESGSLGCDSVQNAVYHDRLFSLWGDTNVARYPLGIFDSSCGTTIPQPLKAFEPPIAVPYELFRKSDGQPRGVAPIPGKGPTWLSGMVVLPDASGRDRLCAMYTKIRGSLTAYESGLCVWNDETEQFEPYATVWNESLNGNRKITHMGHAVPWTDSDGKRWVLFGDPFPILKVPASFEAWADHTTWESVAEQSRVAVTRDAAGSNRSIVEAHRGNIAWNEYRKRWIAIFTSKGGLSSYLGDIWYAEADSPFGPWGNGHLVISLNNYTFYNPKLHADWTPSGLPVLLFEGTYTHTFSKNERPTPRYDYNQILYRLDLDKDLSDSPPRS